MQFHTTTKSLRVVVMRMELGMVYEMALEMKGTEPSLKQILNENPDICKAIYSLSSVQDFSSLRYFLPQRFQKTILCCFCLSC